MDLLLDPTVAYLILLTGIVLGFLAFVSPGTGFLELGALFCLVIAGYVAYNLSINWWALIILMFSLPPFVMAVRNPGKGIYLGVSIVLLILGTLFLFPASEGLISVNPIVAVVASGMVAPSLWIMLRKAIEAMSRRPTHDPDSLVGQIGETKTRIHNEGSVYIGGELWSARSESELPSGIHVRVIRREGFVLVVESAN